MPEEDLRVALLRCYEERLAEDDADRGGMSAASAYFRIRRTTDRDPDRADVERTCERLVEDGELAVFGTDGNRRYCSVDADPQQLRWLGADTE